jgi:hypothetical protein
MPQYQQEVGIALVVVAACSLATFALTGNSEGKVQLPTYVDEADELQGADDPFAVTRPEDVIDGIPVDGEGFWKKVRVVSYLSSGGLTSY